MTNLELGMAFMYYSPGSDIHVIQVISLAFIGERHGIPIVIYRPFHRPFSEKGKTKTSDVTAITLSRQNYEHSQRHTYSDRHINHDCMFWALQAMLLSFRPFLFFDGC